MGRFIWNPNDLPVGIDPIGNGWTLRSPDAMLGSIQSMLTPVGDRAWTYQGPTSTPPWVNRFATWTDGPRNVSEVEVLSLQRTVVQAGIGHIHRMNVSGNANGYFLGTRNNANEIRGRNYVDGAINNMGAVNHGLSTNNVWLWIRSQSFDAVHRVKAWPDGTNEPEGWMLEEINSDHANGDVGVGDAIRSGVFADVAWFSVGTDGHGAIFPSQHILREEVSTPFFLYGIPDTDILLPPTNLNFSNIQQTSMRLNWTAPS